MRQFLVPLLIGAPLALAAAPLFPGRSIGAEPPSPPSSPSSSPSVSARPATAAAPPVNSRQEKSMQKSGDAFPFPVDEKVFENGLRAYAVHYDSPGLVAFYSVVRTGS